MFDKKLFKNKPIIVVKEGKDESKKIDESGYDKVRYNRINSLISSEKPKSEEKKEKVPPERDIRSKTEKEIKQEMDRIRTSVKEEIPAEIPESAGKESADKKEPEKKESEKKEKVIVLKKYPYKREIKRKSKAKVFIPVAVIIILGFSIYFLRLYNFKISGSSEKIQILPASNPVEIARSYDIPVDYPYQPNNQASLLFDGIDSSVYKGIGKTETAAVEAPANENDIPTVKQGTYKDLGHYIFTDGKIYFVQVSSWKYKSSAIDHMKRLIKEGYHASVERVISNSGEIYFRVKLGNFKSLEEAKKYAQNN